MVLSMASPAAAEARSLVERSAGRLVGRLAPEGYVVAADGIVVGPTGVSLVTTLASMDRLRVHSGELWQGRFPCRQPIAQARRRAQDVREQVDAYDPDLPIRSFLCVVGSPVPQDPYCVLDLPLCGPHDLPDLIRSAPTVLALDEVLTVVGELRAGGRRRPAWLPGRRRPTRAS